MFRNGLRISLSHLPILRCCQYRRFGAMSCLYAAVRAGASKPANRCFFHPSITRHHALRKVFSFKAHAMLPVWRLPRSCPTLREVTQSSLHHHRITPHSRPYRSEAHITRSSACAVLFAQLNPAPLFNDLPSLMKILRHTSG